MFLIIWIVKGFFALVIAGLTIVLLLIVKFAIEELLDYVNPNKFL